MEGAAVIYFAAFILVLIFAVVSIMVPFYILRIRNEVIQINKKMTDFLSGNAREPKPQKINNGKRCKNCGLVNQATDVKCVGCRQPL